MAYDSFGKVDSGTRALRAAMTVPPPPGRLWVIDQTIRQLKQHGIWQKLDLFYVLAAHDAQAARLNWKNPSLYACTEVNSPTFTKDQGYAGNGTTSYLNTNWAPGTHGVNFTQNSGCILLWDRTARAGQSFRIAGASGAGYAALTGVAPRWTDNNLYGFVNASGSAPAASLSASAGLSTVNRSGATALEMYRDGASVATAAGASSAPTTNNIWIGGHNLNGTLDGPGTDQISVTGLSASLDAATQRSLFAILRTHLNRVGAV